MFSKLYDAITKSWTMPWHGTGGAAHVSLSSLLSGEENETAKYDSLLRTSADFKSARVTTTGSAQDVFLGPCRIGSIINENVAATTVIILDDAATLFTVTIPALSVLDSIRGQRFLTSLKVNASAGPIAVQYREAKYVD